MTRDEWAEGSPYWKAPKSEPSDSERSTWGQGSWDAEMRERGWSDSDEVHDVEDSVQLLISLTAGKAEKSARYIIERYEFEHRRANHYATRLAITERLQRSALDEMHSHRRSLAELREQMERVEAWARGVETDNDMLRRDIARLMDQRDEARHALKCFELVVNPGAKHHSESNRGEVTP